MANRTEAQLLDLMQACIFVPHQFERVLDSFIRTAVVGFIAQTQVGDDVPENRAMVTAVNAWLTRVAGSFESYDAVILSMLPAIARLVGAPSNDRNTVLDYLQQYMIANSKAFKRRGITNTPVSPSNEGDGVLFILDTDLNGDKIDVGHEGTLRLLCNRDNSQGATAGNEQFIVTGLPANRNYPWQEGSPAIASYNYAYGSKGVAADIGPGVPRANVGAVITAKSAGSGNLVVAGAFNTGFESSWSALPSNWTANATTPINGTGDVRLTANGAIEQDLQPNNLKRGQPYAVSIKAIAVNGGAGTVTGTLTVAVMDRDEGTTHFTQNITVGNLVVNTATLVKLGTFWLPFDAKDLKIVITMASIGGSAATPTVGFCDLVTSPMTLIDGKLVAIHDGTTLDSSGHRQGTFKFGDRFDITVADQESPGVMQRLFGNRFNQRYFNGETAASGDWEDPEGEQEMHVLDNEGANLADGGSDDRGEVAVDSHTINYTLQNTGTDALWLGTATIADETNVSAIDNQALNRYLYPGESMTLTIQYTTTGGAWSFTVSIDNNDADENPYNWAVEGTTP